METQRREDRRVLIAGAGVIGCSVAYFLSKLGYKPVIIDKESEPAGGASGKAGGFLARKWNNGSAVGPLTKRSYKLHEEHGILFSNTYYRPMDAWSVSVHPEGPKKEVAAENLSWLDSRTVSGLSHLSKPSDTAQVHPLHYTKALFAATLEAGGKFEQGEIIDATLLSPSSVQLKLLNSSGEERILEGDILVVCLGSWSDIILKKFLDTPQIMGAIKASSVVFKPSGSIPNVALFTDWYTPGNPNHYDPEVYPRPDDTVYICACAQPIEVPKGGVSSVEPEKEVTDNIETYAAQLSPFLANAPVLQRQACVLPTTLDDTPIIGEVSSCGRVIAATGHSCWGILNAPATGETVAQLIHLGKTNLNITAFDPKRFNHSAK